MKISQTGLKLIEEFEGCRLTAYQDVVGVWTIGYGHTKGVKRGQCITREQAEHYLIQDVSKAEQNVNSYHDKYNWNQNQFDAMVSFAFNIGSINQLTANGTRPIAVISEKILQYNKAGGKVVSGLTRRRKAERLLFDKPITETGLKTENTTSQSQNNTVYQDIPTLRIGSKGLSVKLWQIILGLQQDQIDGVYGPYTKQRTIEFQAEHGLLKDGVVGPKTWEVGIEVLWARV
jgi:GH24 family phage-related lysozyme (muramidase)